MNKNVSKILSVICGTAILADLIGTGSASAMDGKDQDNVPMCRTVANREYSDFEVGSDIEPVLPDPNSMERFTGVPIYTQEFILYKIQVICEKALGYLLKETGVEAHLKYGFTHGVFDRFKNMFIPFKEMLIFMENSGSGVKRDEKYYMLYNFMNSLLVYFEGKSILDCIPYSDYSFWVAKANGFKESFYNLA